MYSATTTLCTNKYSLPKHKVPPCLSMTSKRKFGYSSKIYNITLLELRIWHYRVWLSIRKKFSNIQWYCCIKAHTTGWQLAFNVALNSRSLRCWVARQRIIRNGKLVSVKIIFFCFLNFCEFTRTADVVIIFNRFNHQKSLLLAIPLFTTIPT